MSKLFTFCRLGRDAELRSTPDGTPVANLALAYNYGKKQDGDQPTQWLQASLWGKRAEATAQYLTKGTALVVTLSDVHVRMFDKKDGTQGASLNARLDDFEFVGGQSQSNQQSGIPRQQYRNASGATPQQHGPQAQPAGAPGFDDDLDSDIPF